MVNQEFYKGYKIGHHVGSHVYTINGMKTTHINMAQVKAHIDVLAESKSLISKR